MTDIIETSINIEGAMILNFIQLMFVNSSTGTNLTFFNTNNMVHE
jgi:hypothetical protein